MTEPTPEQYEAFWDQRYGEDERAIWSGRPNGTLVVEVDGREPGTVLDVGAGEGADAVWLAEQGWTVTALEPSGVALARARAHADQADVDVTWIHAGILEAADGVGQHDVVSAQYPAIPSSDAAIDVLLAAVRPGGTLLFVHHDMEHHEHDHAAAHDDPAYAAEHDAGHHGHVDHVDHDQDGPGFDPNDFVMPDDVVARLGDGWDVEVHEVRDRPPADLPEDAQHVRDIVLRARRR